MRYTYQITNAAKQRSFNSKVRRGIKAGSPHSLLGQGFTLIELMIVVGVISILAAIALPAYLSSVKKSHARSAGADLSTLALNMENKMQMQLAYPVYDNCTAPTSTTFSGWQSSQTNYFTYCVQSTSTTYTLQANGVASLAGCNLTIDQSANKTITGDCGGMTSW